MTTLEELLNYKKCFKLICGAGNENLEEVEFLVSVFYEAGCRFFDLCMSKEVLDTAKKVAPDAFFCVSTGIKGDPHINKAKINFSKCRNCRACYNACLQDAIVDKTKCIGCMRCKQVCKFDAIDVYSQVQPIEEILPSLSGYHCVELHCSGDDEADVDRKWDYISSQFDGLLSLCMDRSKLGNEVYLNRIKRLIVNRKPYTTIIQADGAPMSGGEDDYKTTLQAVAMAEIVENSKLPVYILLSGGTNSKTIELAKKCGLSPNGVSIGSFARKIVKGMPKDEALEIAKDLIKKSYC